MTLSHDSTVYCCVHCYLNVCVCRRLKFNKGIRMRDPDQQQRKKIEKLETQLRLLQEGGTLESRYSYSGSGLRGRIPGSLRVMSL